MPAPRDRAKSTRRRIAGERSRQHAGAPTSRTELRPEDPRYGGDVGGGSSPAAREVPTEHRGRTRAAEGTAGTERTEGTEAADSNQVAERAAGTGRAPGPAETQPPRRWTVLLSTAEGIRSPRAPVVGPPRWSLLTLAGLLVAALALDGLVVWRWISQRNAEEAAARALHSAVVQAPAVAEKAGVALLSYRYDALDQDVAEARRYLTEEYRPQYTSSIEQLVAAPAADIQATVKAEVLSSGVVEASGARSDVLLFVNQTTTSASSDPKTALNRVVLTMVRRDGRWLVDEIRAL